MEEILALVLSMLLVLALVPLFLWKRRQDTRPIDELVEQRQAPRRENVVRGGATGGRSRMQRRPAVGGPSTSSAATAEGLRIVKNLEDWFDSLAFFPLNALFSAWGQWNCLTSLSIQMTMQKLLMEVMKKLRQMAIMRLKHQRKKENKRQEREAQRRAEETAHESRQTKHDRYAEVRRRKDEEREAEEHRLFEKWKGGFSVDAEGTTENEVQDGSQDLLSNFVEYIKNHKCIPLEDLAAEFKLRTQECINRITSLESMGRLSGVMDDRGKYIYISMEEMKPVADYIKRQGRVSISHLAIKSNQFIDLEPKVQFGEEISIAEEIIVT
ncbi:hypothetical protein REPUB_Repub18cG0025300 [Reevesia pubescens]